MQNISTDNKAKWYEIRRNELLELIEKTSSLQIQEKYAKELAEVKKKCLENQFEIVLIGEFQGGKSTTFNALCDGRDLSPRGLGGGGIKTSAAIISAQNISDGETCNGLDEWAEITFKSKYDIQAGMFQITYEMLTADDEFRSSVLRKKNISEDEFATQMANPDTFAQLLDLDDPAHRRVIKKCLNYWWKEWNDNKFIFNNDKDKDKDNDPLDRLRIATLLERFYGTSEYNACIANSILGIYDFQKLITFPTDWEKKWEDGQNASFTFDEVAFVFIAHVLLRIKSSNLAALGCRISDCPGLGANDYDTKVAKCAIIQSDAIWYLIGGEKQIGEKDLESLNFIKSIGMDAKITGSVNLKGRQKQKLEQVFPVTQAKLKESGFTFDLLPYNARLAFLAAQGKRIVDNQSFSDYELNCMKSDFGEDDGDASIEYMWTEMVRNQGFSTGIKELKMVDSADSDSVASVTKASCFNDLMTKLSEKIISQKSRSILIDNGSARAVNALQEYEGILKISEDAALQDEKDWAQKVEEAKAALKKFINDSEEILDDSTLCCERGRLSRELALELVQAVVTGDAFITRLAFLIQQACKKHENKLYWTKETLAQAITRDIKADVTVFFKEQCICVLENWKKGNAAADSWYTFETRFRKVTRDIKELWEKDIDNRDYVKNISFNLPDKLINENLSLIQMGLWENAAMQDYMTNRMWSSLGNTFFGIAMLIPMLACAAIVGVIDGVKSVFQSDPTVEELRQQKEAEIKKAEASAKRDERKIMQEAQEKLVPKLKEVFSDLNRQNELSGNFVDVFDKMQTSLIGDINKILKGLLENFENDYVAPAKRNFTLAESKRKEIAEENHKIRVEQIEPVRKEIRAFEQQVSLELQD